MVVVMGQQIGLERLPIKNGCHLVVDHIRRERWSGDVGALNQVVMSGFEFTDRIAQDVIQWALVNRLTAKELRIGTGHRC